MTGRLIPFVALTVLAGLLACLSYAEPAQALPPDFSDGKALDVPGPTALDFTPSGRMLITSKAGQAYSHKDGQRRLILDLGRIVCSNSERGLLGVAVDPRFGTAGRNFVYLYYTRKVDGACSTTSGPPSNPVNRVSRFVMKDGVLARRSEDVLIDNIRSPKGNHNAGDLHFGPDGNLYVSVGDGGCDYAEQDRCQYENDAARDKNVLLGKILRIEPDGSVPADNPFTGPGSARCALRGKTEPGLNCRETYLKGFRNPFRFAVDPDAGRTVLRINDVGGQRREEIDQAKVGTTNDGNDYGWNLCEGTLDNPESPGSVNCDGEAFTGPIHQYGHGTGCQSITGGAFVPDGSWPASYDRAYLFGDFVCGKIFRIVPRDGGGYRRTAFASGLGGGGPIAMVFGPAGKSLYFTTFAGGGQVRRITYSPSNRAQTARANDPAADEYGLRRVA